MNVALMCFMPSASSKKAVQDVLSKGQVCILDIDMQVRVCSVYVHPGVHYWCAWACVGQWRNHSCHGCYA